MLSATVKKDQHPIAEAGELYEMEDNRQQYDEKYNIPQTQCEYVFHNHRLLKIDIAIKRSIVLW